MSRLFIGLFFLQMSFLSALVVNENFNVEKLKGKKVGYYIGSFDPIHLGHQHLAETSLDYVDYVLIYPVPGGDSFKNRSEHSLRQEIIASVYKDHPKILLTEWTPRELQDNLGQVTEFVGVVGSDFIQEKMFGPDKVLSEKYRKVFMRGLPLSEKHYEDTVGALMALKADSFLVSLRGDIDLSYLNGWVDDRPILAFIQSSDISSTEVRKAIREKRAFEHLVAFPVQAIIKEKGLYGFS